MRFLSIVALSALLLTSCLAKAPPVQACEESNNIVSVLSNIAIGEGTPVVTFEIGLDKINIYNSSTQKKLQVIPNDLVFLTDPVQLVDMNFDGYLDVRAISSQGTVNTYYNCWLWDQTQKKFVLNAQLSELASPVFDAETKTITSYTRISVTDNYEATYSFYRGELLFITSTEQIYDHDRKLFIINVYDRGKDGLMELVSEKTLTEKEMLVKTEKSNSTPFPGAAVYQSPKGFSLLLPERALFKETAEGVDIRSENWAVIISQLGDAVDNLDNKNIQAGLEKAAIGQSPLARCKIEWTDGTDTMEINNYAFYYRPFTGTLDGATIERGEFYYANINGKHFRIITAQLPGIGDSIILLVKMLRTIVVE